MRRARYLLVTAALAVPAGCGGDDENPDRDQIAQELARDVQAQTGTKDVLVTCSGDVSEGDLCDVKAPGGLRAKVRIVRLEDGNVEGEVVQP
jgi:hypothetical protein